MSSELMRRTADVLEKMAEYLDQEEQARQVVVQDARLKVAQKLRHKIAPVTGEAPTLDVLEKIAASGESVVEVFNKLAERQHNEPPEELGDVRNFGEDDRSVPMTKTARAREEAAQADQAFIDWIMT